MLPPRSLAAVLSIALSTPSAGGHEFWTEVKVPVIEPGASGASTLRVRQGFEAWRNPTSGATAPVEMRQGGLSAVDLPAPEKGLTILFHDMRDDRLARKAWEQFTDFLRHEDAP